MVPVGGELGVAITTEQERIKAAFDEGTLALQARSREEHVLRWIYRSENMGQAGQRGSPISLKIGPWGHRGGATPTEWSLFCSSLLRSGASRGRNASFLRGLRKPFFGRIYSKSVARERLAAYFSRTRATSLPSNPSYFPGTPQALPVR